MSRIISTVQECHDTPPNFFESCVGRLESVHGVFVPGFAVFCLTTWHSQVDCLANMKQDGKACFSRVGRKQNHDYSVTFSDGQRLQDLRRKFFRSRTVLESTLDIVKGCELQCRELEARGLLKSAGHIYHELEGLASNLRYHRRTIVDMLEYSAGTANLV